MEWVLGFLIFGSFILWFRSIPTKAEQQAINARRKRAREFEAKYGDYTIKNPFEPDHDPYEDIDRI